MNDLQLYGKHVPPPCCGESLLQSDQWSSATVCFEMN